MSLHNRTMMYPDIRRVNHADSEVLLSTIDVDVSEAKSIRLMGKIVGNAAAAGNFTIYLYGKLGEWISPAIDTLIIVANGTNIVYGQKLIDVSGFDKILTRLSYSNVATKYVDAEVQVGIPHSDAKPAH